MIHSFKEIGEELARGKNKKELLKLLSYKPSNPDQPTVIFNLDTSKKQIDVRAGDSYQHSLAKDLFFSATSPRGKKIYFNTNNDSYFVKNTIPDLVKLLTDRKLLSSEEQEFKLFLERIKHLFFSNDGKNLVLRKDLVQNDSDTSESDKEFWQKLVQNVLPPKTKGNLFELHIDGKNICETEYAETYEKLLYYDKVGHLFDKSLDGKCHLCNEQKNIAKNPMFPFKTFITDKHGFAENLSKDNFSKKLGICEDCLLNVSIGMNFLTNNRGRFLDNQYLIISKNLVSFDDFFDTFSEIKRQTDKSLRGSMQSIVQEKKYYGAIFDLLFYHPEQNSDKVVENINDIAASKIKEINDIFSLLSKNNYELHESSRHQLSFRDLRDILFSKNVKTDDKHLNSTIVKYVTFALNEYIVDLDLFLEKVLRTQNSLVKSSTTKETLDSFNQIMRSYLFIEFFVLNKNLESTNDGGMTMEELYNTYLNDFFKRSQYLDSFKKGLVCLGYHINKIDRAQGTKNSKFSKKLNYQGTDKQEMIYLVNEIERYEQVYKKEIFGEQDVKIAALDSVNKYLYDKTVEITPQEVTYLILLGINIAKYIGYAAKKNGAEKGDEN